MASDRNLETEEDRCGTITEGLQAAAINVQDARITQERPRSYKCPHCDRRFDCYEELTSHSTIHNPSFRRLNRQHDVAIPTQVVGGAQTTQAITSPFPRREPYISTYSSPATSYLRSPLFHHSSPFSQHSSPLSYHSSPLSYHSSPLSYQSSPFSNYSSPFVHHSSPFFHHSSLSSSPLNYNSPSSLSNYISQSSISSRGSESSSFTTDRWLNSSIGSGAHPVFSDASPRLLDSDNTLRIQSSAPNEIVFFCTFCAKPFRTFDHWKKHEATIHLPRTVWMCKLEPCAQLEEEDCKYYRSDNFFQHITEVHPRRADVDIQASALKFEMKPGHPALHCGFCFTQLLNWQARVDHVAQHYHDGYHIKDWQLGRTWSQADVHVHLADFLSSHEAKSKISFSTKQLPLLNGEHAVNSSPDELEAHNQKEVADFIARSPAIAAKLAPKQPREPASSPLTGVSSHPPSRDCKIPEPLETLPEHDVETSSEPPSSREGETAIAQVEEVNQGAKEYIIDKLMQKVYDLLGLNSFDSSESGSSLESNLDDDDEGCGHGSTVNLDDESKEVESHICQAGSNENSRGQPQGKRTSAGSKLAGSISGRSLCNARAKRQKGTSDSTSEDEDEGKGKKRKENPKLLKGCRRKPRFACPFYKKSPEVHGRNGSCLWPGFDSIPRLKEHLYRVHVSHDDGDTTCPRCRHAFESGQELVRHLAMAERCVQTAAQQPEDGLNGDQLKKLRSRDRGAESESKWRTIYRICHNLSDDAETPWPYCDQDSPADQAVEGYDLYQRQHLPRMIRERLEQQPDIEQFLENFGDQLPTIIRDCQNSLYRRFTGPRSEVAPVNEQDLPEGNATYVAHQADEHTKYSASYWCSENPPVAFEAAPNTENGMTSSEAQQVHDLSGQRGNLNSDSGYGTGVFEPHQPLEVCGYEHSDPQAGPSGDAPQTMQFPHHSYPSPNPENWQSASADKPLGEQDAHRSNRESSTRQTNSVQVPSFTQPAFSFDHGQPFMTHVDSLGNNSTEETCWDSIDLSLFDEIGPGVLPSMHNPFQNRISDEGGMEDLYDFEL